MHLLKPAPWAACIVSFIIFSPVLWWNFMNEGTSFIFQLNHLTGLNKHNWQPDFSSHLFLGGVFLLLGPAACFYMGWLVIVFLKCMSS